MKVFFLSGGTYQNHKTSQKWTKAFESFLRILIQFCRSRFRLINSEQKFRCKSQGTGIEKLKRNFLERNQDHINEIWRTVSLSISIFKYRVYIYIWYDIYVYVYIYMCVCVCVCVCVLISKRILSSVICHE